MKKTLYVLACTLCTLLVLPAAALMASYNTIITDAAGATVYSSSVNSQQVEIDINAWGATGVYYMSVYDASGALVAVRHIALE